jgi:hypothetical protein
MIDLKTYFDAARSADENVQKIMNDIHAHFEDGTDEGKQAALDLRPTLDEAKAKAEEANKLYLSMRDAAAVDSQAAKDFVPVNNNLPRVENKREMKRGDFLALDASARMEFIKGGGNVLDEDEE